MPLHDVSALAAFTQSLPKQPPPQRRWGLSELELFESFQSAPPRVFQPLVFLARQVRVRIHFFVLRSSRHFARCVRAHVCIYIYIYYAWMLARNEGEREGASCVRVRERERERNSERGYAVLPVSVSSFPVPTSLGSQTLNVCFCSIADSARNRHYVAPTRARKQCRSHYTRRLQPSPLEF